MVARAIGSYRRTAVETADAGRLVLMAYEGAIQALREAEESLAAGNFEAKARLLVRAQDFLSELAAGLNPEAGELATNLRALYAYMLRTLTLVDLEGEGVRLKRVREMLEELYSAWQTIVEEPRLREASKRTLEEVTL